MHENEVYHHNETRQIDTGSGRIELSSFEEGQLPHWRLCTLDGQKWLSNEVSLVIQRDNCFFQVFDFSDRDGYLESILPIPEPHGFKVCLSLNRCGQKHDYDLVFYEHEHEHEHSALAGLDINSKEYQDAHELAHANDIKRRFVGREVTNWQILLFGLTGGLIPCPAAITVLLICIQLKAITLGATLVICFSIGLAITLVTVGVGAALNMRHIAKRWKGFNTIAKRAPYFSSVLIACVGIYMGIHGWLGLMG